MVANRQGFVAIAVVCLCLVIACVMAAVQNRKMNAEIHERR